MKPYLNTEEAAAYLGIRERKLYELVANGAIPCSKVTGKWLFPRAALDRWIETGLQHPPGFVAVSAPPIIGGSHDPLLEWAARRAGAGLALLSVGSQSGLNRLARNEVAIAAVHFHSPDKSQSDEVANLAAVSAMHQLADAVVIGFARREQGLVVATGNPLGIGSVAEVLAQRRRIGLRQPGAGAQLLIEKLLDAEQAKVADLNAVQPPFATGDDLAFAIRAGTVDCGVATRAVAQAAGLGFVPLAWEHFDLVMRRRTYFGPGPQALLGLMRTPEFHDHAARLGGFDTQLAGEVRLNR